MGAHQMSEVLPVYFTPESDPRVMRLVYAYRPFKPIDVDTTLSSDDIKQKSYVSLKELTTQLGLNYQEEMDKRR